MSYETHVVAVSGGKDSTALALRLAELKPEREYSYIITPTGNEPPAMFDHWERLESLLGKRLIRLKPVYNRRRRVVGVQAEGKTIVAKMRTKGGWVQPVKTRETIISPSSSWGEDGLRETIELHGAIPSFRQRWCTERLKILPTLVWLKHNAPIVQYVGLRADEEHRGGIYGDIPGVEQAYPFREWGWGINEVVACNDRFGVTIPERTDCDWCYHQRLAEWWWLWSTRPESYWDAAGVEAEQGHTFRSPGRDTWPAGLLELASKFAKGHKPRGVEDRLQGRLFQNCDKYATCRVCTL